LGSLKKGIRFDAVDKKVKAEIDRSHEAGNFTVEASPTVQTAVTLTYPESLWNKGYPVLFLPVGCIRGPDDPLARKPFDP
jgi:hypothetical protein